MTAGGHGPRVPWQVLVVAAILGGVGVALLVDRLAQDPLPLASRSAPAGTDVRVEGRLSGRPAYWSGTAGDGAGVVVRLDSGDEVLLLAGGAAVEDFRDVVSRRRVEARGTVVARVTPEQVTSYGFAPDDFGVSPIGGRIIVLLAGA